MNVPERYRRAVYIMLGVVAVLTVAGVVAIYGGWLDPERLNSAIGATFGVLSGIITGGASILALLNITPDIPKK